MFELTEQRICDQARALRKNGWLSELELEEIWQMVGGVENLEHDEEQDCVNVDIAFSKQHLDFAGGICIEENQSDLDHFADMDHEVDLSEEEKAITSQIKNMAKENTSIDGTRFKKVVNIK